MPICDSNWKMLEFNWPVSGDTGYQSLHLALSRANLRILKLEAVAQMATHPRCNHLGDYGPWHEDLRRLAKDALTVPAVDLVPKGEQP